MPVRVLPSGQIKIKPVDACLAPLVYKLNNQGIQTWGSCCGHGKSQGDISIDKSCIDRAIELGYTVKEECNGDFSLFLILV